jgi:succinoglycan biosynthesis protein ExoL
MARVLFFAFDIAEAAQLRRIDSLRALGHSVASVSFRRDNMAGPTQVDWPDLPLGPSSNNRYMLRLARLLRAVGRLWRQRRFLDGGDVWIARNIDMLLLAQLMRTATGRQGKVRLVYECLDIHGLFTRGDAIGAVMRWAERRLLARCDLLILSSPGFLDGYFRPLQHVETPVALVENKLWIRGPLDRPTRRRRRRTGAPFTLGWVGSLRCAQSLAILAETARRMGPDLLIRCHGAVHRHALGDFDRVLKEHPNISHHGSYRYPDDLRAIYEASDAVWAQDLWQSGANSDWLLPNRIYEASYFGCPSIAVAGTQTGRRIAQDGLGFTVAEPTAEALEGLISGLDPDRVETASASLLARPASDFRLTEADLSAALSPVLADRKTPTRAVPARLSSPAG